MPKDGRRGVRFETIGSVSAIVVAVASLFVAWDEARSVRRQQAASVLPILKVRTPFRNDERERSYRIEVANVGVGPAFVEAASVTWDGVPVRTAEDLRFNVEEVAGEADFWTAELEGQVLGGGESMLLYEVAWAPEAEGAADAAVATVRRLWEAVDVAACYCSVYDRCWRTEMDRTGRPDRVARCEAD